MNQRTNIKDAGTYVFIELFNNIDELNMQSTLLEKQTEKKQLVKKA